jgi:cyclophilin family peptidyl-prolyl cis-trans isomerase
VTNDKRARHKQFQAEKRAQAWAAYRRRRALRIGGVLLFVILLAVAIGTSLGGDDKPKPPVVAASSTPTPTPVPTDRADTSGEVACPDISKGERPTEFHTEQYKKAKEVLKEGVDYSAVIRTSCGDILIDLAEDTAPITVNNFVFLAKKKFFDGMIWHRVESNFVIQAGDPNGLNGTPPDGPGYAIKDELPEDANEYKWGTLAMANSGPDSGGSQFFIITHSTQSEGVPDEPAGLPASYSIFGQVDPESYPVLDLLDALPTQQGDDPTVASMPTTPAFIYSIKIIEN